MGYTFSETKPAEPKKGLRKKILIGLAGVLVVLLVVGAIGYRRAFHGYPPKELMHDIKAGVAARHIKDPNQRFEKYLEGRYGDMSDPANRQKAFLAFFDQEHIRALEFLATHAPKEQQQANIQATANWVGRYRTNLTAAEKASLAQSLKSQTGRQMLRQATAQYNTQDIYYRGRTAPVISQLLTTIHEVGASNP